MSVLEEFSQELVILSTRLIGEKVLFTDTEGIIIGCSDEDRVGELHEASLDVLRTRQSGAHDTRAASGLKGTFEGITLPLEYGDSLVGTVGITGDPQRVSQYGQMIKAFAEMMLRYRAGQFQRTQKERECQDLVRQVMHFNGSDEKLEQIRAQAESMGYDLSLPRAAVLIRAEPGAETENDGKDNTAEEMIRQYFDRHQYICAVPEPRKILALPTVPEDRGMAGLLEDCRALYRQLEAVGFRGVICLGSMARGIRELRESCEDARMTSGIALHMKPRPQVITAEETLMERMIISIPSGRCQGIRTALNVLNDQRDAAELRHLIRCWCENSFSISDTARAMFIHKNTLIYRIERVERLTGFRLRSFRDAMLLYMAVCIQQYGEQQE